MWDVNEGCVEGDTSHVTTSWCSCHFVDLFKTLKRTRIETHTKGNKTAKKIYKFLQMCLHCTPLTHSQWEKSSYPLPPQSSSSSPLLYSSLWLLSSLPNEHVKNCNIFYVNILWWFFLLFSCSRSSSKIYEYEYIRCPPVSLRAPVFHILLFRWFCVDLFLLLWRSTIYTSAPSPHTPFQPTHPLREWVSPVLVY